MKGKKQNQIQTSKKQKFVGHKILVDPETGDTYPMQMNVIEDRDFNFHKVWLQHLINGLDDISNQKLRLAFWLIENLDKENQVVMTQRKIADESGISIETVNRTMKVLCKNGFLQKINGGAYRVNPDVLFKGSHSNRMGICYQYSKTNSDNRAKLKDGEANGERYNTESPAEQSTNISAE